MANIVRAAIVQTEWTGDKESMIDKHVKYVHQAAEQGTQVMCFQELFNDAYFCQVQEAEHMDGAERIPDGPTMTRMKALARETEMVLIVPIYEKEDDGFLYNSAAVIERDGTYLGKYRKTHIPHVGGFWEKYYFRPGNMGYPTFDTSVGRIGVYICYDRHFPEGWRALGLNGAKIVFNPSATSPRSVDVPVGSRAAGIGGGERVLHRGDQSGRQGTVRRQRLLRLQLLRGSSRAVRRRCRIRHGRRARRTRPRDGHDRRGPQAVGLLP
jgi:uncharacterized protein YheU (UPF0270 family)